MSGFHVSLQALHLQILLASTLPKTKPVCLASWPCGNLNEYFYWSVFAIVESKQKPSNKQIPVNGHNVGKQFHNSPIQTKGHFWSPFLLPNHIKYVSEVGGLVVIVPPRQNARRQVSFPAPSKTPLAKMSRPDPHLKPQHRQSTKGWN